MSTNEVKAAVIASAAEQFRALFESHYDAIRRAATESFIEDDAASEPRAKVTAVVEFDALAQAPVVAVRLGWSARFRDESEQEVDPLQSKLGLDGGAA
jgi:hypothetical protein